MRAIILAAGLGSRLLPLTADRPKCLVPVGGRTILEQQLSALRSAGVTEVAVVGGYRFDRLEAFVGGLAEPVRPRLVFNPAFATSSSIGSVRAALDLLDGPFLIVNGDTVHDRHALAAAMRALPPEISLFIEPAPRPRHDDMRVRARSGRVLQVGKSLGPGQARHRSVGIVACAIEAAGLYRAALEAVLAAPGGDQRFHHDIVDRLARQGNVAAVTLAAGSSQEIDSAGDIRRWLVSPDSLAA